MQIAEQIQRNSTSKLMTILFKPFIEKYKEFRTNDQTTALEWTGKILLLMAFTYLFSIVTAETNVKSKADTNLYRFQRKLWNASFLNTLTTAIVMKISRTTPSIPGEFLVKSGQTFSILRNEQRRPFDCLLKFGVVYWEPFIFLQLTRNLFPFSS